MPISAYFSLIQVGGHQGHLRRGAARRRRIYGEELPPRGQGARGEEERPQPPQEVGLVKGVAGGVERVLCIQFSFLCF